MFIAKKALPRRTFLRGLGATLALPMLDAMVPALGAGQSAAVRPRRLGFIYLPNGVARDDARINYWKPAAGADLELSPVLAPLEPFRERLVVLSGLSHVQAEPWGDGNGDHTRGTSTWLSGVHPKHTEGGDIRAGTTADQIAAQTLGEDTAFSSLELGLDLNSTVGDCENGYSCAYMNTLAWRTPTTPLPTEPNPRVVFERLFADGGTDEERRARVRKNRSILDSVSAEMTRLQQALGSTDRSRAAEYFDALRDVERRIQKSEQRSAESSIPILERPSGIPDGFSDHVKMMFDLQWLAFQGDLTRVITFMMGRELNSRTFPEVGVVEGHHGLSHHRDNPGQISKIAKINTLQSQLFAYFLDKLQSTPDGDGTLLDHTLLLYGAGLANPNAHSHRDLALLVAGGTKAQLQGGRHLEYPLDTPMTNLLLSLLDKVGIPAETLGDSTGRLDRLEPLTSL
jgi:Protein of unknown function (DUF1552)